MQVLERLIPAILKQLKSPHAATRQKVDPVHWLHKDSDNALNGFLLAQPPIVGRVSLSLNLHAEVAMKKLQPAMSFGHSSWMNLNGNSCIALNAYISTMGNLFADNGASDACQKAN